MRVEITARDLITRGNCTARCLLALGPEAAGCSCTCSGRYHGMSVDHVVASEFVPKDLCGRGQIKCLMCGQYGGLHLQGAVSVGDTGYSFIGPNCDVILLFWCEFGHAYQTRLSNRKGDVYTESETREPPDW